MEYENFIKETNSFYQTIGKILNNLKNVSSTLNKQIISSIYLMKEVKSENQYSIKVQQLSDRIGMLEDSRKLLKENIKIIEYNINNFLNNTSSFLKFNDRITKINNSNNIGLAKNSYNFLYQNTDDKNNLSLSQNKNLFLNSNVNPANTGFNTINYSIPLNMNLNSNHNSVKSIILNSNIPNDSNLILKNNNYLSHKKNIKIKTDNEIDYDSISRKMKIKNKKINNSIKSQLSNHSLKYSNSLNNYHTNNSNSKKSSRNFSKSRLIKKARSLSNFISEKNLHFNKDNYKINNLILNNTRNYNSNANSLKHKNIINNTIINNKNEIKSNMINNINYNNIINNNEYDKINEYSFFLSSKVLEFLYLIREMKTKYNSRNSINKKEFKETKIKYEKIKKLIHDVAEKIFHYYYKNKTSNNIHIYNNHLNSNKSISTLLKENKIYQNKVYNLEENLKILKNKLCVKERENNKLLLIEKTLLNDNSQKNLIISQLSNELEKFKNGNKIKNFKEDDIDLLNNELIDDEKINKEENYINELKFQIESKNQEIKLKDKSIENLKSKIKNNNLNKGFLIYTYKNLFIENVLNISFINDIKNTNNIDKSIIDEKDEIIYKLKIENESLKQKINENSTKTNNDSNTNINHINNNNYIIKELKEKIHQLTEDNSDCKNKNNILLDENKSLNQKIDELTNDINNKELINKEKENEIKKLELIIEDLNSKINKNIEYNKKMSDEKEKEDQIEFLMTENQELKNQIEELRENENNSSLIEKDNKKFEDYETKIKFLTSQNNYYQNELNNLKTENGIIQNEFKNLKEENNVLKRKIKDYYIKNENGDYLLENFEIIGDKNVGKLSWILLKKKGQNLNDSNYDDYIWVERNIFGNIDNK